MKIDEIYNHINHDSELFRVLKYLPKPQEDGPWLAGGSVWKAIENQPIAHDLDFFFKTPAQCAEWVATLRSVPYAYHIVGEKSNKYNATYKFHVNERGYNKTVSVQCVSFKFWETVGHLIDGFDFTACQFAFDGKRLFTGDTAFEDLRARAIRFNKITDSYATQIHLEKYLSKGFTISEEQARVYEEMRMALAEAKRAKNEAMNSGAPASFLSPDGLLATVQLVGDSDDGYPLAAEDSPTPATPTYTISNTGITPTNNQAYYGFGGYTTFASNTGGVSMSTV